VTKFTPNNLAIRTIYWSILLNLILVVVKGLSGYFGNSYALIADSIESGSDVLASVVLLFGLRFVAKPPDSNHPYGHGRLEPLLTFIVVIFLLLSASFIAYKSVEHIQTPHELPKSFTLYVLALIIVFKELSYRYVKKKGKESNSLSLQAEAWHHRSDAISSLFAFVGISVALILGKGYENADDWAALVASVFIVYNAYLIFRPALGEILDEHVYDELIVEIREISKTVNGVEDTEKCFVRKTGMMYHIDLHLIVNGELSVRKGHAIAHQLKEKLMEKNNLIADVLIHVEPK
jgi:cation diffusion facilitator family transporter